jgi:hypothetical protein
MNLYTYCPLENNWHILTPLLRFPPTKRFLDHTVVGKAEQLCQDRESL